MRTRNLLAAALAAVCASSVVAASAEDCPSSLGTAQQVVCLQEQNAILQQRLSNAQIEQTLSKINGGSTSRDLGLPSVSAIFGRAGKLHAMLAWQDATGAQAGTLDVVAGATLPGGMRVEKIEPGHVFLSDGHRTHVLLMSGSSAGSSGSASNESTPPTAGFMGGVVPPLPSAARSAGR